MEVKIETEHLILRNLNLSDVSQEYVDWLNDLEINRYLSCANTLQTMESCFAYVQSYEGRDDAALIGIFLRDNGLHIGNLTLSTIDWDNKTGTIGICIGRKEYIGKGLGKEALRAIVTYCLKQLNLNRLQAYLNTDNTRSLNLFTKCGFKVERLLKGAGVIDGRPQNDYIVSITEADF